MCTKQRSDHLPLSFFLTRALTLLWPALFLTTHPFFLLAFFFSSGRGCGRKNLGTGHFLDQHFLVLFLYHAPFLPKKRTAQRKGVWPEKQVVRKRTDQRKGVWSRKWPGKRNGGQKKELVDRGMVDRKKNWWTWNWWTCCSNRGCKDEAGVNQ